MAIRICGSRISDEQVKASERKLSDHLRLKGNKAGDVPGVINIPVTWNVVYKNETIEGGFISNKYVGICFTLSILLISKISA